MDRESINYLYSVEGGKLKYVLNKFGREVLGLPNNKQLKIEFEVIDTVEPTTWDGSGKMPKGVCSDKPLTKKDWKKIDKFDFSAKERRIVDFFKRNRNKLTSMSEIPNLVNFSFMMAKDGSSVFVGAIQKIFNKHGGEYGLRTHDGRHDGSRYKIYKIIR